MLVQFWMVLRLTREIHELERERLECLNMLSNYQKYSGMLGGSSIITGNNLAGLNSEILPRAMLFAQYSDQASSMAAMQRVQQMQAMGRMPIVNDPIAMRQMQMSAFAQFKEEALKAQKQQEMKIMDKIEGEIKLKLASIDQKIKEKETYKESVKNNFEKNQADFFKFG